jgi:DNA-binding beta-propeller fold protein YncE
MRRAVVAALLFRVLLFGQSGASPAFTVDSSWPRLPNNQVTGPAPSIAVDSHDNVWLLHRPRLVAAENRDKAAPPVIELDSTGRFVRAWGGPGEGYEWPSSEHNIFVDSRDNVWISGAGPGDNVLLKFTAEGRFLLQIGRRGESGGNRDTRNLSMPADAFVDAKSNEVFVADGYGNRRIIVFDAESGAFKRMWGAFGNAPDGDRPQPGRGGRGAAPQIDPAIFDTPQFELPHTATVSNDGIVYVADTIARRLQIFTVSGKYQTQIPIHLEGPAVRSAAAVAFSPGQDLLYVADYGNSQIVTIHRKSLRVINAFGKRSSEPGDFQGLHDLAVDSKGVLYTAEVTPGSRFQRFVPIQRNNLEFCGRVQVASSTLLTSPPLLYFLFGLNEPISEGRGLHGGLQ